MKQILNNETKECLKRFKEELPKQGIKVLDIAYTENQSILSLGILLHRKL